jgi:hypothetical protein
VDRLVVVVSPAPTPFVEESLNRATLAHSFLPALPAPSADPNTTVLHLARSQAADIKVRMIGY